MGLLADDQPPPKELQKKPGIKIERSCQDCFFLILFIAFWAGMIVVAVQASKIGNPDRLIYGTDYKGNLCGTNNLNDPNVPANKSMDHTDRPYVYYMFNSPLLNQYYKICVKECPSRTYFTPTSADELICIYNVSQSLSNLAYGTCAGTYNSKHVLNRCFPVVVENVTQVIAQIVADDADISAVKDLSNEILSDVVKSWKYILISAAIAFALGLVWIILLRWFAGVFIWLTILFVMAALVVTAYIAYTQSEELQDKYDALPIEQRLKSQENNILALRYICYILAAAGAIILLFIMFMLGRIQVAIGIVKETSKAVGSMTSIFFFPILIFVLLVGLAAYWLAIAALLGTAGVPTYDEQDRYVGYEYDKNLRYTQLYHLFGGFWSMNFILAIGQCTIAGSIAAWYWVHDKKDVPRMPVWTAFWRTIRYHLGSLAFGSLILAIVQVIRVILAYLEKQFKGKEQRLARFFIRCLQCIFAYFERFIKFLNKNAYIMVAIYGYSFCSGARRGFELVAKNFIRVAALNFVSKFLMFIGKLFICLVTCFIAFIMLKADGTITFYVLPVILIGILSYAIANAFMSVYEMAIDTMLLCFCEDTDRNDGSAERPYYMSNSMKHYMNTWRDMCCCCVVGDDDNNNNNTTTVAAKA